MAYIQYLVFNGRSLPKPDSYDVGLSDVEADSGGETSDGIFQTAEDRSGIFRYGNLGLKRSRNVYYRI